MMDEVYTNYLLIWKRKTCICRTHRSRCVRYGGRWTNILLGPARFGSKVLNSYCFSSHSLHQK